MKTSRGLFIFYVTATLLIPVNVSAESARTDLGYWERIKQHFRDDNDHDKSENDSEENTDNEDEQDLTEDTMDWLKSDMKNIGAWEYKVLEISLTDPVELETKLNLIGQDKWECFWIKENENKAIMLFRKPKLSYLKILPVKDLLKLISPTGDEDGGTE